MKKWLKAALDAAERRAKWQFAELESVVLVDRPYENGKRRLTLGSLSNNRPQLDVLCIDLQLFLVSQWGMAESIILPYLNGYGYIEKVLNAIKPVPAPPKFTQNFLETKLNIKSTSARPIIPFLKKIGFLTDSGVPTERYKRFRNSSHSGQAIKEGLLEGYGLLFEFNEYANELSENELEDLIVQATNSEKGATSKLITKCFYQLKSMADFNSALEGPEGSNDDEVISMPAGQSFNQPNQFSQPASVASGGVGMNLSYTINLNLPETTNSEVFDAIFQALNKNILKPNG